MPTIEDAVDETPSVMSNLDMDSEEIYNQYGIKNGILYADEHEKMFNLAKLAYDDANFAKIRAMLVIPNYLLDL